MVTKRLVRRSAAVIVSLFCASTVAHAQATRTWVSGVGDDANPCSRTAPCKTFAGAISKTAAGGEIDALDPGSFGAVTITKAISISGDGTLASILNAGTNGIIVNAGVNDDVVIRNISIQGAGTGLNGIRYLAGRSLLIENCSFAGYTTHGIDMSLAVNASGQLKVVNSTFSRIGGVAVRMTGSGIGTRTTNLSNVRIRGAGFGFDVLNGVGNIAKSVISNVTNQAVVAEAGAVINVDDSVLTNNGTGVSALSGGATVRIANTAILHNGTGINTTGGTVASFGGNKNIGNTTAGAPNANIVLQ